MSFYRDIQKTANEVNLQITYLKETAPHYFESKSLAFATYFDDNRAALVSNLKAALNFVCLIFYYPLQTLAIALFFFTTRIYFAILPYEDYLS